MASNNINIGPGLIVSEWIPYTPTGTWVTNVTYTGFYKRVGDTMLGQIQVLCSGAPDATSLSINLPSGLTADSSKMPSSLYVPIGQVIYQQSGAASTSICTFLGVSLFPLVDSYSSTVGTAYINSVGSSNTIPYTFGSGDTVSIEFSLPIAEWG